MRHEDLLAEASKPGGLLEEALGLYHVYRSHVVGPTILKLIELFRGLQSQRKDSVTGFDRAPDRYMATGKEACDVIREEFDNDQLYVAWCIGSARKYELRAGHKAGESFERDREKARWYRLEADYVLGLGPSPRAGRST